MNDNGASAAPPHFRHDRVVFAVLDGSRTVSCSVSKAAIQEAAAIRSNLPADILAAFGRLRERIEAVALAKIGARGAGSEGLVHIWSGDLDDDPDPVADAAALHAVPQGNG